MTETAGTTRAAFASPAEQALLPIREVCRLTGVNPITLRAWERRYGLIQPTRTDSGHRLYSHADLQVIRSVLMWIERGVAVSKVAAILARSDAVRHTQAPCSAAVAPDQWLEWQQRLRAGISRFDSQALEQVYAQLLSNAPLATAFEQVLMPVWQALLLRKEDFGYASQWLFFDAFLRARALQRLQLTRVPQARKVLLATLPQQCWELEILLAGLLMSSDSVAVEVLPAGLSLEEISLVCDTLEPQALVLFSNRPSSAAQLAQWRRLALGLACPLALAGSVTEFAEQDLQGTPIASLGSAGLPMQRRLAQLLTGRLDT